MTWCLAYVHPKALHCSGERGKGLGLSGGNSQGWPCPGKDSAVGVWHPKTIPGSPIQHQFKAGTSVAPALAGGMLSEEVVELCLSLVPAGTG